jgi:hypothetical protein
MNDRVVPEQVEVAQAPAPVTRRYRLIPLHAKMTMEKWDKYRAEQRALPPVDLTGMSEAQRVAHYGALISEFPTQRRLDEIVRLARKPTLWQKLIAFFWQR